MKTDLEEARELAHKALNQHRTVPEVVEQLNECYDNYLFSMAGNGSIMMQDTRSDYVKPVRVV